MHTHTYFKNGLYSLFERLKNNKYETFIKMIGTQKNIEFETFG